MTFGAILNSLLQFLHGHAKYTTWSTPPYRLWCMSYDDQFATKASDLRFSFTGFQIL